MLLALSEALSPRQQINKRETTCFILLELRNWKKEKPAMGNRGLDERKIFGKQKESRGRKGPKLGA
jgi:hypothetical protein